MISLFFIFMKSGINSDHKYMYEIISYDDVIHMNKFRSWIHVWTWNHIIWWCYTYEFIHDFMKWLRHCNQPGRWGLHILADEGWKSLRTCRYFGSKGPYWSSGIHSQRLFQKAIEGFDCKINGRAFGTALCSVCCALWHSFKLGRLETQSVSELAAVAAGSDRIAQGKCYHSCFTELVWGSKRFDALQWQQGQVTDYSFFFHVK